MNLIINIKTFLKYLIKFFIFCKEIRKNLNTIFIIYKLNKVFDK